MNPPPYQPPPEGKNPIVRQVLLASLIALPVVALIAFTVAYAVVAHRKTAQTRAAWDDIASSSKQMQANYKKNFDPKKGITNADFAASVEFRSKLEDASQKLSGDDSVLARVGAEYVGRLQAAATNYQIAAGKMREAHVLDNFDSSNKAQIQTRREIVRDFMDANTALKQTVIGSEEKMRADLTAANVKTATIDAYLQAFHSTAAPRNALIIRIRQCDDRVANTTLDVLSTLETNWGRWEADPSTNKIRFKDHATYVTYTDDLATIKATGGEQLKLQGMLVNLPIQSPQPTP